MINSIPSHDPDPAQGLHLLPPCPVSGQPLLCVVPPHGDHLAATGRQL